MECANWNASSICDASGQPLLHLNGRVRGQGALARRCTTLASRATAFLPSRWLIDPFPAVRSHGLAAAVCHVPQLKRGLRESDVEALLKKVPVKLGAGKLKVSALHDPETCAWAASVQDCRLLNCNMVAGMLARMAGPVATVKGIQLAGHAPPKPWGSTLHPQLTPCPIAHWTAASAHFMGDPCGKALPCPAVPVGPPGPLFPQQSTSCMCSPLPTPPDLPVRGHALHVRPGPGAPVRGLRSPLTDPQVITGGRAQ